MKNNKIKKENQEQELNRIRHEIEVAKLKIELEQLKMKLPQGTWNGARKLVFNCTTPLQNKSMPVFLDLWNRHVIVQGTWAA